MAYDLEEQEQIDTLKAWWKQYGNLVTWILIAMLTTYAGWTYWSRHQQNQSVQASQLYETQKKFLEEKNQVKIQRVADDLKEQFPQTSYASMAALAAAKSTFDASDLKNTEIQLQWVIDHSKIEEYKAIARIRLASVLLDEKAYDRALLVLSAETSPEFAVDVSDRKGDIYVAQNDLVNARNSYGVAIEKAKENSPARQLIQLKLDSIGGASTSSVASVASPSSKK